LRAGMPDPGRFFFGLVCGTTLAGTPGTTAAVALAIGTAATADACAMTGKRRRCLWPPSGEDNKEAGRRGDSLDSPGLRPADELGSAGEPIDASERPSRKSSPPPRLPVDSLSWREGESRLLTRPGVRV
jgi:hypothetical protein